MGPFDSSHRKQKGQFEYNEHTGVAVKQVLCCTPISLLERVCYNETCFFPHNRPKITQEERREIVFESLVFL